MKTFLLIAFLILNLMGNSQVIETTPMYSIDTFGGEESGTKNRIWWISNSIDVDHFTLSRSEDGIHWVILKIVKCNSMDFYEVIDSNPYSLTTYYSISETDSIGNTKEFEDVIDVENNSGVFYWWKQEDYLYLNHPYEFEIYNTMGQIVKCGSGISVYTGDLKGIYILKIGNWTQKISFSRN